jgi:hypothetical protein
MRIYREHRVGNAAPAGRRWLVLALLGALFVAALPVPAALAAATCVVSSTADNGPNTLRQCLASVDTGGTITFSLPNPSTITLTSGELTIARSLTITGPGAAALAVSGNDASRVFAISGGTINISGLTITRGRVVQTNLIDFANRGAGLRITGGAVTLTNTVVTANTATGNAGASNSGAGAGILVNSASASLALVGSAVNGNTIPGTLGAGTGVQILNGTVTLTDSTVNGNTGPIAVHHNAGTLTITDSPINGNTGPTTGIALVGGTANVIQSVISGNLGRGISQLRGTLIVRDSTISDNTFANGDGGGLFLNADTSGSTATITGSTISGNHTASNGGGIYIGVSTGTTTIANSTISGNSAAQGGGGIFLRDEHLVLRSVTVTGNVADSDGNASGTGGGIATDPNPLFTPSADVRNTIVAGNRRGAATADDCAAAIAAGDYNLWGDNTACPAGGAHDLNLATLGQTIAQVLETTLDANGGPTLTHALVEDSPARHQGDNVACAAAPVSGLDQRGIARPGGATCDIGAVEGLAPPKVGLTLTTNGGGAVGRGPAGGGSGPYT